MPLIGLVLYEVTAPLDAVGRGAAAPVSDAPPGAGPAAAFAADRMRDGATILARPLFTAGRRPASAVSVAGDAAVPRLSGVIEGPAGPTALFVATTAPPPNGEAASQNAGKPLVARVGDSVQGWVVQAISAHAVILASGERILEVRPRFADDPAVLEPAAPVWRSGLRQSGTPLSFLQRRDTAGLDEHSP